jgi:cephalosporin hydroxylase
VTSDGRHDENPLEAYFDGHHEGPGIWKWRHYFGIYDRHLSKFIGQEVHVVEIGVFSGGSLGMWRAYFGDRSRIYGVDISSACLAYSGEGVRIFIGDQADPQFWARFREEVPVVDVVIDDGGHQPHQQAATIEALLPHITPGGVYICEDLGGADNDFHSYIDGFSRGLHVTPAAPGEAFLPSAFQQHVASIHRYPFIVVVEKPLLPVPRFEAPAHGTEWQPPEFWKSSRSV